MVSANDQSSDDVRQLNADLKQWQCNAVEEGASTVSVVLYSLLCALFIVQLLAILHNHSHLGGLTMFDTVFLLIVKAHVVNVQKWLSPGEKISLVDLRPFLLAVGLVVLQALVFVNFTHALEAISCADSSSHFSRAFLASVALNLCAKLPLIFWSRTLSVPHLCVAQRHFLHFGASLVTLGLAGVNWRHGGPDDWIVSRFDRYLGAAQCVALTAIVVPSFARVVPFLLCDVPQGVSEHEIREEIEQKFPNIRCTHLHLYRKWPVRQFDAFAHIALLGTGGDVGALSDEMRALIALLKGKGARKVTLQPWLLNSAGQDGSRHCVTQECEGKSCCAHKALPPLEGADLEQRI